MEEETKKTGSLVPFIVVIVLLLGGFLLYKNSQTKQATKGPVVVTATVAPTQSPQEKNEVKFALKEVSSSSQSGTAELYDENGKVKVVLSLTGGNFTKPQPAHIHSGTCPTVGKIVYPLNDVVNGKSETTISASMKDLIGQLPLAVNVHKSQTELKVYTACGDIPQEATSSPTGVSAPTSAPTSGRSY